MKTKRMIMLISCALIIIGITGYSAAASYQGEEKLLGVMAAHAIAPDYAPLRHRAYPHFPVEAMEAGRTEELRTGSQAFGSSPRNDSLSGTAELSTADGEDGHLRELDLTICGLLKSEIERVAAGQSTSTVFEIPLECLELDRMYSASDLGIASIMENGEITEAAMNAMAEIGSLNTDLIIAKLLSDMPYELFWFDKTQGVSVTPYTVSVEYDGELDTYLIGFEGALSFGFPVASEYAAGEYEIDESCYAGVGEAVAFADDIASQFTANTVYERLYIYGNSICYYTSYNDEANDAVPYGNPWQMIWVFDSDDSTRVVCEGYAKAFQYLVDQSEFDEDIRCITVTGTSSNGTGAGAHMWNIVTMPDGLNYLVDVTNCDEGAIGFPDMLFLAGSADGSVEEGYRFQCNGEEITYTYDDTTLALYDRSSLELASRSYARIVTVDNVVYCILGEEATVLDYDGVPTAVTIPSAVDGADVIKIDCYAFYNDVYLERVVLPQTLKWLGDEAFSNCRSLKEINIPDKLQYLGDWAFWCCVELEGEVTLPASVELIAGDPFLSCLKISAINVSPDNPYYASRDGVLYDKDLTYLIYCPAAKEGPIDIPKTVRTLNRYAFAHCGGITGEIIIPEGVREIPFSCFNGCENLDAILLPEGLTVIGECAFTGCRKVRELSLPLSLAEIGPSAFQDMESLTAIDISHVSLQILPYMIFCGCRNLVELRLPETIEELGGYCYSGCQSLSGPIDQYLTDKITYVAEGVFSGCTSLTGTARIPSGQSALFKETFYQCSSLEGLVLPESVTSVDWLACAQCSSLTDVQFEGEIQQITEGAFADTPWQQDLRGFVIIKGNLIDYRGDAKEITIPKQVSTISESALANLQNTAAIFVDAENTAFKSIDGVLFDYSGKTLVLFPRDREGEYCVPDGVEAIGRYAFRECKGITTVVLPMTLSSIGENAFRGAGLVTMEIPDSVTKLGTGVFYECERLVNLRFGNGAELIPCHACLRTGIKQITLPEGVKYIDAFAFYQCESLKFVDLPASLLGVARWAFEDSEPETIVFRGNAPLCLDGIDEGEPALTSFVDQVRMESWIPFGDANSGVVLYTGQDATGFDHPAWEYYTLCVAPDLPAADFASIYMTDFCVNVGDTIEIPAVIEGPRELVAWYSSDSSVAAVDQLGNITAVNYGEAIVTAYAGNIVSRCRVTVKALVKNIELSEIELTLCVGQTRQLLAVAEPDYATDSLYWSSDCEDVATVDQEGIVYGVAQGTVTITVMADSGAFSACVVHVTHTPGEAVRENEVAATCNSEGSYDEVIYCTICHEELSRETKTLEKLVTTPGSIDIVTAKAEAGKTTITWTACSGATAYIIQRRVKDTDTWTTLKSNVTGLSYEDTTGAAGTVYQYRVRGRDGTTYGPFKVSSVVRAQGGSVVSAPGAIASVTAKAEAGKTSVTWTASSGATAYIIQRRVKDTDTWTTLKSNVNGLSYEDTTGDEGTVYQYRVRGRNGTTYGPFKVSGVVRAQGGSAVSAPGAIASVTAKAEAGKTSVTWTASSGATAYIIQRRVKDTDTWTTLKSNVNGLSYEDTTGEAGTVYQYRVRGRNGTVYGPFKLSSVIRAQTAK